MSLDFWVDSSTTAVYLMNRLPSSVLPDNKSPFKLLFHRTPEYTSFRVFGCRCFPYLHVHASHKFSDKSLPCVFLLGTLLTSMAANVIIHQQDECIPADMFSLKKEYFHSRIQPYCHLLESDPYITNSLDRISSASHTFQVSQPLIPPPCAHNWACLLQHLWKHKKIPLTLLLQCPLTVCRMKWI